MAIFLNGCFWANLARKHRFLCSGQKRMLFKQEMSGFKKVQKIELFQTGQSMVFCKNAPFFQWWYLGQSSQKRSSFEILDRKEWFLDKKSQVLCFSSKIAIFLIGCFWANLARKNLFFFIFWIKNAIQTRKVKFYKSLRKSKFSKGVSPDFGPKLAIFPSFYFSQYRPGKICFTIFQNEKTPFQAIKTRSSKR